MAATATKLKKLRKELSEWDRLHGYDFPLMLEEKPELFRALLKDPTSFHGFELGEQYLRFARSLVSKAEQSPDYREVFLVPQQETQPKERLSIGRIVLEKKTKRKKINLKPKSLKPKGRRS